MLIARIVRTREALSDFKTSSRNQFTFGEELQVHLVIDLQLDEISQSKFNMEMATNYMMLEELVLGGLEGMDSSSLNRGLN